MFFDPISLFLWLALILFALMPHWRMKALLAARQDAVARLQRRRGSKVITLIHRQERVGLFGIPFYRYIDIEDSEAVLRAIRSVPPDTPIDLIIHTPGGMVLAAAQIARALKRHPAKTTVIVPHYAMSGGTLIALAADEIIMDPNAVLGPVDPQIGTPEGVLPAASVLRAVEEKGKDASERYLVLADISKKALQQMRQLVVELLSDKMGEAKAKEIAERLSQGTWTHDYPITVDHLRELGIEVSTDVPSEVYELMELYPQAHQTARPAAEFIPHRGEG